MDENEISMHENKTFMNENENFAKNFMGENSMHEIVYSPITHENFWGVKIMPGANFSFTCMEIWNFHTWK